MRRAFWLVTLIGIFAAMPTTAEVSGDTTGACWIEFNAGNQEAVECIEDVTESACSSFCSNCTWEGATACTDLKILWEGSCFFADTPPGGGCWLWLVEPGQETAEFHCEQTFNGDWYDDLMCGAGQVPTLPRAGQAALALVLLAGSLLVLSLYSRSSAA